MILFVMPRSRVTLIALVLMVLTPSMLSAQDEAVQTLSVTALIEPFEVYVQLAPFSGLATNLAGPGMPVVPIGLPFHPGSKERELAPGMRSLNMYGAYRESMLSVESQEIETELGLLRRRINVISSAILENGYASSSDRLAARAMERADDTERSRIIRDDVEGIVGGYSASEIADVLASIRAARSGGPPDERASKIIDDLLRSQIETVVMLQTLSGSEPIQFNRPVYRSSTLSLLSAAEILPIAEEVLVEAMRERRLPQEGFRRYPNDRFLVPFNAIELLRADPVRSPKLQVYVAAVDPTAAIQGMSQYWRLVRDHSLYTPEDLAFLNALEDRVPPTRFLESVLTGSDEYLEELNAPEIAGLLLDKLDAAIPRVRRYTFVHAMIRSSVPDLTYIIEPGTEFINGHQRRVREAVVRNFITIRHSLSNPGVEDELLDRIVDLAEPRVIDLVEDIGVGFGVYEVVGNADGGVLNLPDRQPRVKMALEAEDHLHRRLRADFRAYVSGSMIWAEELAPQRLLDEQAQLSPPETIQGMLLPVVPIETRELWTQNYLFPFYENRSRAQLNAAASVQVQLLHRDLYFNDRIRALSREILELDNAAHVVRLRSERASLIDRYVELTRRYNGGEVLAETAALVADVYARDAAFVEEGEPLLSFYPVFYHRISFEVHEDHPFMESGLFARNRQVVVEVPLTQAVFLPEERLLEVSRDPDRLRAIRALEGPNTLSLLARVVSIVDQDLATPGMVDVELELSVPRELQWYRASELGSEEAVSALLTSMGFPVTEHPDGDRFYAMYGRLPTRSEVSVSIRPASDDDVPNHYGPVEFLTMGG